MTTLQLIFLLPFVEILRGEKINFALKFFLPFFGIIAGWGTEAGSAATIFLTAIFIILACRKNFFQSWMAVSFVTLLTGFAANIFAPGNVEQLNFIRSVNPAAFNFTIERFIHHFCHGFLPLIAINLFALLPMLIYFFRNKFQFSDILMIAFATAGFIIPLAMMLSPKFELRVTIVSMIFILPAATMAIEKLKNFPASVKKFLPTVSVIICLIFATSGIFEFYVLDSELKKQEEYILQNREQEVIKISTLKPVPEIISKINGRSNSLIEHFGGAVADSNAYLNVLIAKYHGANKIIAVP